MESPRTISERVGESRIRRRDSVGWPYFGADEVLDHSMDDALVFRHASTPIEECDTLYVRSKSEVYVFEGAHAGCNFAWYTRSNLIALDDGTLYAVYFEHNHVLDSYAWLAGSPRHQRVVVVRDSGLFYRRSTRREGVLEICGVHIHRSTGDVVVRSHDGLPARARADCMRMRPPVPWYSKGFFTGHENTYARQNVLNQGQVVRLQRWVKTLLQRKRARFHAQFRLHGLFALLSDDTFDLLVHLVFIGDGRKSSVSVVYLGSSIPKCVTLSQRT